MQKISEIAIVRHYKGKSRTILVGVYAKRKRTISKALVEKYGFTLQGVDNVTRTWNSRSCASIYRALAIRFLIPNPGNAGVFYALLFTFIRYRLGKAIEGPIYFWLG